MSRISIDVTDLQHARLKALAALKGLSIKEFVLSMTLGQEAPSDGLAELESLLDNRITRAEVEGASQQTVGDIFRRARLSAGRRPDA